MAMRKKRRRNSRYRLNQNAKMGIIKVLMSILFVISSIAGTRFMLSNVVFFPLREIEVIGNKHLSNKEIRRMSQVRKGTSLLSVSSQNVVRRVGKSPWIKNVSLRKELPNTMLIKVKEAVPSALLKKDGAFHLVSSDGVILEKQTTNEKFLPVITGDTKNKEGIREAVRLAQVIKQYGVNDSLDSEILIGELENMTLRQGGTIIKIGHGDYENKLLRYLELRDEIVRRRIPVDYVDLRFAKRVIVKPVKEVSY